MGTVARLAFGLVAVVFVGALLMRPLMANPAIASVIEGGFSGWQTLVVLPLVVVTLAIVALRVRGLFGTGERETEEEVESCFEPVEANSWDDRTDDPSASAHTEDTDANEDPAFDEAEATREGSEASPSDGNHDDGEQPGRGSSPNDADRPSILGGQGGVRNKDFEIEEEPPDAALRDHLEHLADTLGEDDEHFEDIQTMESLAHEEAKSGRSIPRRCPNEDCSVRWSERTIFRDDRGHYELVDDGTRIQCLECERVFPLDGRD